MDLRIPNAVAALNVVIKDVENMLSIARDGDLQRDACEALMAEQRIIKLCKRQAIAAQDDDLSNLYLGCECVIASLLAELRMYLSLKDNNADDAWIELINAQESALAAGRAHVGFGHIGGHYERLLAIERLVFPPQVFLSSGFIAGRQECSICSKEYGECDHLIGRPYLGNFCYAIARDVAFDHVSIVEYPADKRCRVTSFTESGIRRSRMTWRVLAADDDDA